MRFIRPIIAVVLVVLGGATLASANMASWARNNVMDREHVVAQSEEILASPAVREAIALELVDELRRGSRIDDAIEFLPGFLAGPAEDAVNAALGEVQNQIVEALARRQVVALWESAVGSFHDQLLDQDAQQLTLGLDEVTDAISPDVTDAIEPVREFLNIPDTWGRITVLERDELPALWLSLYTLKDWSMRLVGLGIALSAGGIAVARRRALAVSGVGLSLALASLCIIPLFRDANAKLFTTTDSDLNRRAADAVWGILIAPVYSRLALAALLGVVVGVAMLVFDLAYLQRRAVPAVAAATSNGTNAWATSVDVAPTLDSANDTEPTQGSASDDTHDMTWPNRPDVDIEQPKGEP